MNGSLSAPIKLTEISLNKHGRLFKKRCVRRPISLTCSDKILQNFQKIIISPRDKFWVHKTNFILPLFIEVPVPSRTKVYMYMGVRGIDITSVF